MAAVEAPVQSTDKLPSGRNWTETTRLMCAAAYLDGTFAQDVVEEILHESHRAVQIPPAVDIAPVARHCVAARQQKILRDVLLAADLALAVVLLLATRSLLWLVVCFLAAWAVVLWDIWNATYHVVMKRLNALVFSPDSAPEPSDSVLSRRIEELSADQDGNVTVYSGFLPFAGAGLDQGGWSFVVDLRKGKGGPIGPSAAERLAPEELYAAVRGSLEALQMANLTISDRLFVSGADIRDDRILLPDPIQRPTPVVSTEVLNRYVSAATHHVRHYQCIRVVDWQGELVVSLYLRFAIRNGRLFCELSKFVLVPLKEELHRFDGLPGKMQLRHVMSMLRRSFVSALGLWLRSPKVVLRPLSRSRDRASSVKEVEQDPFFDYGARVTALDRVRSSHYRRYFQRLDKEMYVKMLERAALDTVVDILDNHGVDTAEIAERRSTIINNGIMMPGGSLQAGNVAVGTKASIGERVRAAAGASNTHDSPAGALGSS
ncbi:MAG TPA: hypothetical protein VHT25_08995 [Solirubrobacteraceae bacterium]|nr:hypothetical protein [Solirubrobacteraceae bacterium]